MSNSNPSTLQSYIDSATGAIQSAVGSITGNTADQAHGDARQTQAQHENAASHQTNKLGPISATPSGGVSVDNPNRSEGSWNQTVGSAKETVGNVFGAEGLKREGREQNARGQGQEAQGMLSDLGEGVSGRVKGTVGSAVAGLTGDREEQAKYNMQRDNAKAQQRSAEAGIQKQADA
ncbi:hypothetical protein MMC30_000431 [Trapelia coarctata]|nr:hypothetical protein [Trapelia coarctata]